MAQAGAVRLNERLDRDPSPNGGARRDVLESIAHFYELIYKVFGGGGNVNPWEPERNLKHYAAPSDGGKSQIHK